MVIVIVMVLRHVVARTVRILIRIQSRDDKGAPTDKHKAMHANTHTQIAINKILKWRMSDHEASEGLNEVSETHHY